MQWIAPSEKDTDISSRRRSRLDEPAANHAEGILYLPAEARFDCRTRLTADILTGKLDVHEAAAKLPAPSTALAAEPASADLLEEIETEESES